jgi:hypothetical protein
MIHVVSIYTVAPEFSIISRRFPFDFAFRKDRVAGASRRHLPREKNPIFL